MSAPASKRCSECGLRCPLTEYYRHPDMVDGRRKECKSCSRLLYDGGGDSERRPGWKAARAQKQEKNVGAIAEDRNKKREEMKAKLASMGLSQD